MSVTTKIDPSLALLLVDASIESYYAFDSHDPAHCNSKMVTPPVGYDLVDCWTGVDTVFGTFNRVECFGVVFRSQSAPYSYIFSFRGTYSMLDVLDDLEFWEKETFVPLRAPAPAADAKVAAGFWSIYTSGVAGTPSMQEQLFGLLDKYQASAQPIHRLLLTGHSLGAALCELFTLDLALSPHQNLPYSHYNYACPQVGDAAFAQLYDSQLRERDPATRTLRIQNTYDIVPCSPPTIFFGYQHVGDAYLVAFYNKDAGWEDPLAKFYDHQALNYQAVLSCAFSSSDGVCINDNLAVPTDAETLVSCVPDPSTLCSFMSMGSFMSTGSSMSTGGFVSTAQPPAAPTARLTMPAGDLVKLFHAVDTTAICDADKATRVMDSMILSRSANSNIFGPAFTVRCRDDFLAVLRAVETASPGDVVVVDGGEREIALAGELLARGALVRGLGGIIVDAGYRDMTYVMDCELPIYSRFVTPLAGTASKLGELQIPVKCGGVPVNPGDIILADGEGVIVVAPERVRDLLESAAAIKQLESTLIARLENGSTLSDGLNLLEHVAALARSQPSSLEFLT